MSAATLHRQDPPATFPRHLCVEHDGPCVSVTCRICGEGADFDLDDGAERDLSIVWFERHASGVCCPEGCDGLGYHGFARCWCTKVTGLRP